jgi:predicted aldo/keto reductase-like oxidoreductase
MKIERREFLKASAATAAALSLPRATAFADEVRNGMPYRTLGKTGEKVSLLCVGGYHIGQTKLTDEESIKIIRTAIDEGVNFLDNAWNYNEGQSEIRMGKALKDGYRDKVILMTKVRGLDAKTAEAQLHDSLRRFDLDTIDLWQFHEIVIPGEPKKVYSEGALEFAEKAREQGKIRYIGFTGHKYPDLHAEMIDRGYPWDTVQMPMNVFDHHFRSFEKRILPMALEKNIGVIAMKTLAGTPGAIPKTGAATARECLQYVMNLPVSTVVSGMDSMEFLRENLETAKSFKPLDQVEVATLLGRTQVAAANGEHEGYKTEWSKG